MTNQRFFPKALVAIAIASVSGFAAAADSSTLAVSATVVGVCKFSAASTSMGFGTLDQTSASNAVVPVDVLYRCTTGVTPSVTAVAGATGTATSRTMTGAVPANTMAYSIAFGAPQVGAGFAAAPTKVVVTGTITGAVLQAAPADTYTENVTMNITP